MRRPHRKPFNVWISRHGRFASSLSFAREHEAKSAIRRHRRDAEKANDLGGWRVQLRYQNNMIVNALETLEY